MIGRVLTSVPGTIHAILSAFRQPDAAALPGEASDDRNKKMTFNVWRHCWHADKVLQYLWKARARGNQILFSDLE